jgi:hypothetical protein
MGETKIIEFDVSYHVMPYRHVRAPVPPRARVHYYAPESSMKLVVYLFPHFSLRMGNLS